MTRAQKRWLALFVGAAAWWGIAVIAIFAWFLYRVGEEAGAWAPIVWGAEVVALPLAYITGLAVVKLVKLVEWMERNRPK